MMMLGGCSLGSALLQTPSSSSRAAEEGQTSSSPLISFSENAPPPRRLEKLRRDSAGCSDDQHTFLFTLYTDAHSILDNAWEFSHASYGYGKETGNSGTYIDSESVGMGNLGYGAVLTHALCADKATVVTDGDGTGGVVESCYDLELRDGNGDGLTVPHSAHGGLAGGFSLKIDNGPVVAEHRGSSCLGDGISDKEWNKCVLEGGFEYCGVRVCIVNDESTSTASLSNLSGSQCSLFQPQCDAESAIKTSSSSVTVEVATDSFSQEVSWEVRKSARKDSKRMAHARRNELLLAGGMPVYQDGTENVLLGQQGVGVPLADNESYSSVACLPDEGASESCFDFRAYDEYGDGMGCGADGFLSLILESMGTKRMGEPRRERVTLTQMDENQARRQQVNGKKRLACMDREKLSKWSYCAVRACANGDVMGLEGNQCDFGQGDVLIDGRYVGVDPIEGLEMKPQTGKPQNGWPLWEDEEEEVVVLESQDLQLNIIEDDIIKPFDAPEYKEEEEDVVLDPSWAEYYENLKPGFKDDDTHSFSWGSVADNASGTSGDISDTIAAAMSEASTEDATIGSAFLNNGNQNKPNKKPGQNGPKPGKKGEDEPLLHSQQINFQGTSGPRKERLQLRPFSTNLLNVRFPYALKNSRPKQLSSAVAEYLLSYFDDNLEDINIPAPSDFNLDCVKYKKTIGPEVRWVMDCDGTAGFWLPSPSSMPRKIVVANVIRDAFRGKSKENFLEIMYGYGEEGKHGDSKKEKEPQKMQQLHGEVNIGNVGGDGSKTNPKRKEKQEKMEAKKQAKLDRLKAKQKAQHQKQKPQDGELNVMGFFSGTQKRNDSPDAYDIVNGNIIAYIHDNGGGGGGRGKGKNKTRQRQRRKRND